MRSILSIIVVSGCSLLVACGGSSEPAKQPSDLTSSQMNTSEPAPPPAPTAASTGVGSTTPPSMDSTTSSATSSSAPQTATLTEADIVAITEAANKGEIEVAKVALKGAKNAQVKSFANMMVKEHGEAEAKGKKLAQAAKITPTENDLSSKLKADTESTISQLKGQTGAELDKAYMESQVKMHRDLLSTIDDKLLPSAKNADLKAHLNDVRQHVSTHLTKAQDITAGLSGAASTGTKH